MENNTMMTDPNKAVMTMGEWLITLIVLAISCILSGHLAMEMRTGRISAAPD